MVFNKSKKRKLQIPKERSLYAFNKIRPGDFILTAKLFAEYTEFMYFPGGDSFCLTNENFDKLLDDKELVMVEELPTEIFNESFELFCCIKSKKGLHSIE